MTTTVDAAIDDTPCRQCRYNLRGLGRDGRCPECGTPVAFSFDGGVLRQSDRAWVARLRTGATVMAWATAAQLVSGALLMASAVVMFAGAYRLLSPLAIPQTVLSFGGRLAYWAGGWLLTTVEPSWHRHRWLQRFIRLCLCVTAADWALDHAPRVVWSVPISRVGLSIASESATVLSVIGVWAMLAYICRLARLVPDGAMAERADTLMYGLGTPLGLMAALRLTTVLPRILGRPQVVAASTVQTATGVCGLAMAVAAVLYVQLLFRLARQLGEEAAAARAAATPAVGAVGP